MLETDILDGVGNEVVYFFGKMIRKLEIRNNISNAPIFSVSGVIISDSDSLVQHLCSGACGTVSHISGEKPSVRVRW